MLQLFVFTSLTARACETVSLRGSFSDQGNVTIRRPIGSCNSDNGYEDNSNMFVCDEDGTLRYLYWMDTKDCANGNTSLVTTNETLAVGEEVPFPSEWSNQNFIVSEATCTGAVAMFDGVPCEISMFSHDSNSCATAATKSENYAPGCNFVSNERTGSLDCCDDGESLRFRMYGEQDTTCSGDAVSDVTMSNDDTACFQPTGMVSAYSFEWTLACEGATQISCPASSIPAHKTGRKVLIGISLLLFLLALAGIIVLFLKRTRVSRYKRQEDEGAENLTASHNEADETDATRVSMQEQSEERKFDSYQADQADNSKEPPTEKDQKPPTEKDPLQDKVY